MRRIFVTLSIFACVMMVAAQNEATFSYFRYQGINRFASKVGAEQYQNPIIPGFHPDPSICRKGGDYYLVNSSFSYFPGIPIWHSTDLVHWEQIGHVLNRPSQLNLDRQRLSAGIYAPDIKYNPFDKKFYLIVTGVGCGGNFFVTTDNPMKGNWSEPVALPDVHGIDPSFLFDNDGKAYIVNNDEPDYKAEYDGHRAIRVREFDYRNGRTVGLGKVIIDKGVHPEDKPIWIEGPHLYDIDGTYYLMAAEGGTADQHSEVVFSSKSPFGPFSPCKVNPILTQRNLDNGRENPITCTGHADLVKTAAGDWYAVFLGCMPYQGGHFNTGRQTFMLPVTWRDGQPIILEEGKAVPYIVDKSEEMLRLEKKSSVRGTDFMNPQPLWTVKGLGVDAQFVRNPRGDFYRIDSSGVLHLKGKGVTITKMDNPAFICRRINSWQFNAQTEMTFSPVKSTDFAGLVCYQDESHFMAFGKIFDSATNRPVLCLQSLSRRFPNAKGELVQVTQPLSQTEADAPIYLRMDAISATLYAFSFSVDGKTWKQVGQPLDARILSTQTAGGFEGAMVGVYATSDFQTLE
jgi:beta-xylosidase